MVILRKVGEQADAADGGRRQDRLAVGLVVERDVAGNDGEVERAAGFADAFDGENELAHDLRPFGIAEIEIVGDGDGFGANAGEVAPAFGHGLLAAFIGIGFDIARRDIGGDCDRLVGGQRAPRRHRRRDLRGVGLDQMVILFPHPAPRAHVGRADDFENGGLEIIGGRNVDSELPAFLAAIHGRSYSGRLVAQSA